jgi:hypothetical protein
MAQKDIDPIVEMGKCLRRGDSKEFLKIYDQMSFNNLQTVNTLKWAINSGNLEVVEYISKDCPITEDCFQYVVEDDGPMLELLRRLVREQKKKMI